MTQQANEVPGALRPATAELPLLERAAVRLGRLVNEKAAGKRAQELFLRSVTYIWIRAGLANREFVEGLDSLKALAPTRGVLFALNHRSFFDQFAMMLALWMAPVPWVRRLYFPVRSNFFYEHPLGMLVNWAVSAGTMYPPIYRQRERAALNQDAIARVVSYLEHPGTLVGMHPEGTRNKGDDPYQLLPAQPGVGQVVLQSRCVVVPVFINGLSNDFLRDLRANRRPGIRRERPVICVIGAPIDFGDLTAQPPRPLLYKRVADRINEEILKLSARERELRRQCASGEIDDDHPGWLANCGAGRFYAPISR